MAHWRSPGTVTIRDAPAEQGGRKGFGSAVFHALCLAHVVSNPRRWNRVLSHFAQGMGFRPSWAIALPEVDTKDAERFLLPYALTLHCHVDWLALLSRLYSEAEGLGLGLLPGRARPLGRRLLEAGLLSRKFFCILLTEHRNRAFAPVNIDPVALAGRRN